MKTEAELTARRAELSSELQQAERQLAFLGERIPTLRGAIAALNEVLGESVTVSPLAWFSSLTGPFNRQDTAAKEAV